MKKSADTNKIFKAIIIFVVAVTAIFTLMPDYLQKTLIFLTPDIDDHRIFDNREVAAGDKAHPWPLSNQYNNFTLSTTMVDSLKEYETVAFMVIHRDSLLFENYRDQHTDTTLSNSFSVAKSIVSLLTGCAINDGYIESLDNKVINYLPWLKGSHRKDLTIRHLLTMSSASSWKESYTSPFSVTTKAYYGRNLNQLIRDIEIIRHPGIVFNYRSGDTQLLAAILNEATGMTLSEYASEKLWKPLGAERSALWSLDRKGGTEKAFCCFNSNAGDFARLGHLVLKNGTVRNQALVPASYIKEMITPVKYLTDEDAGMVQYYGLHWWILNYEGLHIPYARGIFGQYIFVIPEYNAVVVRLGHKRSRNYRDKHPTDVYSWINAALEIIRKNQ